MHESPRGPHAALRRAALCAALAALFGASPALAQMTYEIVYQCVSQGGIPAGTLLAEADGSLYGNMYAGGPLGRGSVFALHPDGAGGFTFEEIHEFSGPDGRAPAVGVVRGPDGALYGLAVAGGDFDRGAFFRLDARGRATVLRSFAPSDYVDAPNGLTLAPDGAFYGTDTFGGPARAGRLFRLDISGQLTPLFDFPGVGSGNLPLGLALGPDGRLYGTTAQGGATPGGPGTVFAATTAGEVTTLHQFDTTDGANPGAPLLAAADGLLYGTTRWGGAAGLGVAFRITTTGTFTKLYDFGAAGPSPSDRLVQAVDGNIYGTTPQIPGIPFDTLPTLFRIDASGTLTTIVGGETLPSAIVFGADGALYGVGAAGVLRLDLDGLVTTVLADPGASGPQNPASRLTELSDGTFSGLAGYSVPNVLYRVGPDGETSQIHYFPDSVPREPHIASNGLIYGPSLYDPGENGGRIFRLEADGTDTSLHVFNGADGYTPNPLLEVSGLLWGTTVYGGANDWGTIFHIDLSGAFSLVYEFDGTAGIVPNAGLVLAGDGNLYGTARQSENLLGTIFRLSSDGSVVAIHEFTGPDGGEPGGRLLAATDGFLYGTTREEGANLWGTIFRTDTAGNLTKLYDFPGNHANDLIEGAPGDFYGTTPDVLFRVDASGNVTTVYDFDAFFSVLHHPVDVPTYTTKGELYGVALNGGLDGSGGIYRLTPVANDPSPISITPASGRAAGGASVTVVGHHFRNARLAFAGVTGTAFTARQSLLTGTTPALPPGTVVDVTVTNDDATTATLPAAFFVDFVDTPNDGIFHDFIETLVRNGITAGCGGGSYCPTNPVRRDQMAVFLLKGEHGSSYTPSPCVPPGIFPDVPCPGPFTDWIEQLSNEGITGGCGGGNYCPSAPVRRDQMAVFLLKAEHGSSYLPPTCTGVFLDVPCTPGLGFSDWIERLAAESITGGCGSGNYCPGNPNTRGQMAVFITKTFNLQ